MKKRRASSSLLCFRIARRLGYGLLYFVMQGAVCSDAQDSVAPIITALRNRDFSTVLTLSKSELGKHPDDYRVWTLRGMAMAGTGNLREALTSYQHALRLSQNYLPALEGAAQTEFQLGSDDAMPLLQKIFEQRPDDPTSHAFAGMITFKKKDCASAVVHFAKATQVIATQQAMLTAYGMCFADLQRNEDAVPVFAEALALAPEAEEARYNLALAQWNAHQSDNALKTLQPLADKEPADVDAITLSADIYESKDDTASAVKLLRKALLADTKAVNVYMEFAFLSYDHASPQVGIDILNAGLTQLPNEPRLYLVRGILLTQFGEFSKAANDFEKASQLDPRLQFLSVAQGLVQSQEHNPAEALAKFRAAAKAHPDDAYTHYLLAEALSQEAPLEGNAIYKEELEAAEKAVKLDPDLSEARDLLGTLYFQNGHNDLAIAESREALARNPKDEQAVYHLILALRKSGKKDEMNELLKRLVELRADSKVNNPANKHYRLYEESSSASSAAPAHP